MSVEKKKLASGHSVEYFSKEESEVNRNMFLTPKDSRMIKLIPGGFTVAENFLKYADKYYHFKFKPTDVMLVTFPKCGTTWTQDIIWTMVHNPNLDNSEAESAINLRSPFIEIDGILPEGEKVLNPDDREDDIMVYFRKLCPGQSVDDGIFLQIAENTPSPRVLKTHLPFSALDPHMIDTCKVVFVARDPKDTCLSFLNHWKIFNVNRFIGTKENFVNLFVADKMLYCPYWGMIKDGWARRNHPNMLFLYYEDMKDNPLKELSKLDKFLQTNLSEVQLKKIIEYTSFDQMKKRNNLLSKNDNDNPIYNKDGVEESGGFFRKGIVGDSKNVFTKEQLQILDDWTALNTADMPGLKYAQVRK